MAVIEALEHHNKVLFDVLNEELNTFRPFYSCNGEPYFWFTPGKITFFSIGEDDVQLVLEKAKVKILESASYLCGIHSSFGPKIHPSETRFKNTKFVSQPIENIVLRDVREERERKLLFGEIRMLDESVDVQDERTRLALELSELVFQKMLSEASREMLDVVR